MALFGEFLIQKNLVRAEDLVEAVLLQYQSQPLPAQWAYDQHIFLAEEMVSLFAYQSKNETDFLTAARESGLVPKEKYEMLVNSLREEQKNLASILLENGKISNQSIVSAMDEFLSTAKPVIPTIQTSKKDAGPKSITFKIIDPHLGGELASLLSEERLNELINILSLVEQNSDNRDLVEEFLKEVHRQIQNLGQLAHKAGAPVIEMTCSLMDRSLENTLSQLDQNPAPLPETLIPSLQLGLKLCEEAHQSILTTKSEESFWSNNKNAFQELSVKIGA